MEEGTIWTAVIYRKPEKDIIIEEEAIDLDGFNYLSGKGMDFEIKRHHRNTSGSCRWRYQT